MDHEVILQSITATDSQTGNQKKHFKITFSFHFENQTDNTAYVQLPKHKQIDKKPKKNLCKKQHVQIFDSIRFPLNFYVQK